MVIMHDLTGIVKSIIMMKKIDNIYHKMNFRDLNYFVTTAKTKHFGKAAKACFVSQPTLSMQLKKLEDTLGVQLFERNNKNVRITREGEILRAQATKILQEADALKQCARTMRDPLALDFHLGVFPTLSPYLLPKITPLIRQSLPNLSLFYVEEKTDQLLESLTNGKLDAIIVALPIDNDKLISLDLFVDPFVLAHPRGHALEQKKSITIEDINVDELLLLEEGHCLRGQALEACPHLPNTTQNHFSATSMSTLIEMVAFGHGITLVPHIATDSIFTHNLVIRTIDSPTPSRQIGLVYRRNYPNLPCCTKLAELIQKSVKTEKVDAKLLTL